MSETKNLNPNNAIMREFQVIVFQWTVGIPVGTLNGIDGIDVISKITKRRN
jgi:hypothetical protein